MQFGCPVCHVRRVAQLTWALNMSYSIDLLPEAIPAGGSEAAAQYGFIVLWSFRERFVDLTTFWNSDGYRDH